MKKRVWIVEMKVHGRWEPTVGCALTKQSSKKEREKWKALNIDDIFRVVKYVREERP